MEQNNLGLLTASWMKYNIKYTSTSTAAVEKFNEKENCESEDASKRTESANETDMKLKQFYGRKFRDEKFRKICELRDTNVEKISTD